MVDVFYFLICDLFIFFFNSGLWPEYRQGSWPRFCDPSRYSEFNNDAISPLRDHLEQYWYSCPEWGITNYNFWLHEWKKHGTCIPNITVIDYFNHTLTAYFHARKESWYGCCKGNSCMIPFAKSLNETRWMGYCSNSKTFH